MANWQTFKVLAVGKWQNNRYGSVYPIKLDKYLEFSDGYQKDFVAEDLIDEISSYGLHCGRYEKPTYIEIDIDKIKCMKKSGCVPKDAWRAVPDEVVSNRVLARAESLDPHTSALINDGISRMNRGEIREFEHHIEDVSGNNHRFIYRK